MSASPAPSDASVNHNLSRHFLFRLDKKECDVRTGAAAPPVVKRWRSQEQARMETLLTVSA